MHLPHICEVMGTRMVKDLLYPGNNYGDVKNVPVCQ